MKNLFSKILPAGLIVGTLDISAAFLYYFIKTGKNPLNVLTFVASGFFGKDALTAGSTMMVAGLLFHYLIAFSFTALFFLLYPKIKAFSKSIIATGIAYGLFVWAVMNLIIVPLSNVAPRPLNATNAIINAIILIICIGIPLSFMANAFYKKEHLHLGAA